MDDPALRLHSAPSAGFDEPFELLHACHRRVDRMLALLGRLHRHVCERGTDDEARRAADDVMRYFDVAGPAHHADEERHVLPRLRTVGLHTLADRLHADHVAMGDAWASVRADLAAIAGGRWNPLEAVAVGSRFQAFADLYARHIDAEERIAFPAVRAVATEAELRAMGQEMAARRGVDLRPVRSP